MFQVYLPIAEISVNLVVMLGLGAAVGFLSGMFGVGGGFLLTPLPTLPHKGGRGMDGTAKSSSLALERTVQMTFS